MKRLFCNGLIRGTRARLESGGITAGGRAADSIHSVDVNEYSHTTSLRLACAPVLYITASGIFFVNETATSGFPE